MPDSDDKDWIFIRIRRRIAHAISLILRHASIEPHDEARKATDPERINELRQQGTDIHETARNIDKANHPDDHD